MRTFEAKILTELANDPLIRPALGGTGDIDLTKVAADPNNYVFETVQGGFLITQLQPGGTQYEWHTVFRPGANKGSNPVITFAREVQEYMFTRTACTELVTKVPMDNISAGRLAEWGGFEESFKREDAWKPGVGVSYRILTLDRWVGLCYAALEAGKAFHSLLEDAKKAKGSAFPVRVDDELHDRWVGAAVLMTKQGNLIKGVDAYNRWAAFIGCPPFRIVSMQPFVMETQEAIIGVNGQGPEVIQCL